MEEKEDYGLKDRNVHLREISVDEARKLLEKLSGDEAKKRARFFAAFDAENPNVSVSLAGNVDP